MEEKGYSVQLADAVKVALDEEGFRYEFYDRGSAAFFKFRVGLGKEQNMQGIDMIVQVHADAITSYGISDINAEGSNAGKVAEFITRANSHLRMGNFEMDLDGGGVKYKCHNRFGDRIPPQDELMYIISCSGHMWARYGNAYMKVLYAGADPKRAVEEAER